MPYVRKGERAASGQWLSGCKAFMPYTFQQAMAISAPGAKQAAIYHEDLKSWLAIKWPGSYGLAARDRVSRECLTRPEPVFHAQAAGSLCYFHGCDWDMVTKVLKLTYNS